MDLERMVDGEKALVRAALKYARHIEKQIEKGNWMAEEAGSPEHAFLEAAWFVRKQRKAKKAKPSRAAKKAARDLVANPELDALRVQIGRAHALTSKLVDKVDELVDVFVARGIVPGKKRRR